MRVLLVRLAALLIFPCAVQAQERIELAPASDWVMNYDEDSCALQRQFGEPGRELFLEMRQFGPFGDLQLMVASPDLGRRSGEYEVAIEPIDVEPQKIERFDINLSDDYEGKLFSYSFDRFDEPGSVWADYIDATPALTSEQKELLRRGVALDFDSAAYARLMRNEEYYTTFRRTLNAFHYTEIFRTYRDAQERAVTGIVLKRAFRQEVFVRTGALHAPMQAMRTCIDELMSHWGIDVQAHRTLSREVEPVDQRQWGREVAEHYPYAMLAQGMQGYLRTRLDISVAGEVTGCHLQSKMNNEAFERVACDNLTRHARFNPALDAQGQAIASYYQMSVIYAIQ